MDEKQRTGKKLINRRQLLELGVMGLAGLSLPQGMKAEGASPTKTTLLADLKPKGGLHMSDDEQLQADKAALKALNDQIAVNENKGARYWLSGILAPEFAFQRANRKIFDDRSAFLLKVEAGGSRVTAPESLNIDLFGNRAVVSCIVTTDKDTENEKKYHNLRLFVRVIAKVEKNDQGEQKVWEWKLLGWANEELFKVQRDGKTEWEYRIPE